jgi:replicative DNA helicase
MEQPLRTTPPQTTPGASPDDMTGGSPPPGAQQRSRLNTGRAAETQTAKLVRFADILGELRDHADAVHKARIEGKPLGAITGLSRVDKELAGAFPIGTNVVHGNTGTGKTALVLQVASNCCCPALFVTCEMSVMELLRRHTARVTSTFLQDLKNGALPGVTVEEKARTAIATTPHLAFVDATCGSAPLQFLYDTALIVKGDSQQLLIVIDSLHSWSRGLASGLSEYEALNSALSDLQRLAKLLKSPILVVSERNRASMATGGANAGAGSRTIEYSAESVIDLERASNERFDSRGEAKVTLKFSKNRDGAGGTTVDLKFHGAFQRFREDNDR